jgi:hypothetical protein
VCIGQADFENHLRWCRITLMMIEDLVNYPSRDPPLVGQAVVFLTAAAVDPSFSTDRR